MGPAPGRKNSMEPLWGLGRWLRDCPQLALPLSSSHSAGLWKCQGWGHRVEGQGRHRATAARPGTCRDGGEARPIPVCAPTPPGGPLGTPGWEGWCWSWLVDAELGDPGQTN